MEIWTGICFGIRALIPARQIKKGLMAQLDRAPVYETGESGFDSP